MHTQGANMSLALIKRQEEIVDLVRQKKTVTFTQLKEHFPDVSEITIRRDLVLLDKNKQLVRVHGGAKSIDALFSVEDTYLSRSSQNMDNKRIIAEKAIPFLKENTSVFIDSGTTLTQMCSILPDKPFLIYTNSISCAMELTRLKSALSYMLGGRINLNSFCVDGSSSLAAIHNVNFDIGLFGTTGYVCGKGFATGIPEEYELKHLALEHCERVIVLMDSSKFGVSSTFFFASPKDVDVVISDGHLSQRALEEFAQQNIKVV